MQGPGELFAADTAIETLVHVTNIGKTDTAFTVAVYTRDQLNGRKALEALKAAIARPVEYGQIPPAARCDPWQRRRQGGLPALPGGTADCGPHRPTQVIAGSLALAPSEALQARLRGIRSAHR